MALNSETSEVMGELEVLRCDFQRMTLATEEAKTVIQRRDRDRQMVTSHIRELEELLQRSEDCQKRLENKIRQTLAILEDANRPPAEVQRSTILAGREKKSGRASRKLRKPHTPFLLWCKDKRHEVCDAHPSASTADLFAIMLKDWDTVSVEDKNRYTELHNALCEKYTLKLASHAKLTETDQVQTSSPDEDNIKQKAMSLLGQYLASKNAQITKTGADVHSESSTSSTSAEVSSATGEAPSSSHALPLHEDTQTSIQLELLGNHLKTAREDPSAYLLFSMEQRQNHALNEPDMTRSQMNASIAKLWRELSPEEKRHWHEIAIAMQKDANADQKILLSIPDELKLEKCPEVSGNENRDHSPNLPSWILEKSMFRKAEDEREKGIPEPVSDLKNPTWEQPRSVPVNKTFTV